MDKTIRIWRVQPTKSGMKAPYFFVETQEKKYWKAINAAKSLAANCYLVNKLGWDFILTEQ